MMSIKDFDFDSDSDIHIPFPKHSTPQWIKEEYTDILN